MIALDLIPLTGLGLDNQLVLGPEHLPNPPGSKLHAVPSDLGPARHDQLLRVGTVVAQQAVQVSGEPVPRLTAVDDQHPAPSPAQHQGGAEAGHPSSDYGHILIWLGPDGPRSRSHVPSVARGRGI